MDDVNMSENLELQVQQEGDSSMQRTSLILRRETSQLWPTPT
jgi:hypothetical protein